MPAALPVLPPWVPPLDTGRPSANDLNALANLPRKTVAGVNTPIPVVYGRDRVFGKIVELYHLNIQGAPECLIITYAFCQGPIEGYETILIDGIPVNKAKEGFLNTGKDTTRNFADGETFVYTVPGPAVTTEDNKKWANVIAYKGTQTQNPNDPWSIHGNDFRGTAYALVIVPLGTTNGVPRVEAIIKGKKLYDPRLDSTNGGTGLHRQTDPGTWGFTSVDSTKQIGTNPTLAFADFAVNHAGWGVDWASVAENANWNDVQLPVGDGTSQPTRSIGLTMEAPALAGEWAKGFRVYMGAFLAWERGVVRIVPERADVQVPGALFFPGVPETGALAGDVLDVTASNNLTVEMWVSASAPGPSGLVSKKAAAGTGGSDGTDYPLLWRDDVTPDSWDALAEDVTVPTVIGWKAGVASGAGSPSDVGWALLLSGAGKVLGEVADGTDSAQVESASAITDGAWHHVAMVLDRTTSTLKLYVDGVLSATSSASAVGDLTNAVPLSLGAVGANLQLPFTGYLDDVRVWTNAQSAEAIAANRYKELDGNEYGLAAYWRLNESIGATSSADETGHGLTMGVIRVGGAGPNFVPGVTSVSPHGITHHFTGDDIVKDSLRLTKRPMRQFPTVVQIEYTEAPTDPAVYTWRTEVQSAELTSAPSRRISKISLPGIHTAGQAKREAIERLNWFISDLEVTFKVFDEGLKLQQGSIIAVTHPIGLSAKLFRVKQLSGQQGRWEIQGVEYDPAAYSNAVITSPSSPDTNLGNPLDMPAVTNLTAQEVLFQYKEGTYGSRIEVNWTAVSSRFLTQYLVEGWSPPEPGVAPTLSWSVLTPSTSAVSPPVEERLKNVTTYAPIEYTIRVYAMSLYTRGTVSELFPVPVRGKFLPPENIPGTVQITRLSPDTVRLDWQRAADIDVWQYEVRMYTGVLGDPLIDRWSDVTEPYPAVVAKTDSLTATVQGLGLGYYVFYIRARDSVGNYSLGSAIVAMSVSAPPPPTGLSGFEVGGTVYLEWVGGGGYASRYLVQYHQIKDSSGAALSPADPAHDWDTLDALRTAVVIPNVAGGTYEFLVYARDDSGNQSTTAATTEVIITSDSSSYLIDFIDFYDGINKLGTATWSLRDLTATQKRYFVSTGGDAFTDTSFSTYANQPLALYTIKNGISQWLSAIHTFPAALTGNWTVNADVTVLRGTVTLGLSLDGGPYIDLPINPSGKTQVTVPGTGTTARIRVLATGTSVSFLITPLMRLRVSVEPREESGPGVTILRQVSPTSRYWATVSLVGKYAAVTSIQVTPVTTGGNPVAISPVVDNVQMGVTPCTFDVYMMDSSNQTLNGVNFFYRFQGV